MVKTYQLSADGETYLSPNFQVKEFACHDGNSRVLIDTELVEVLQKVRDHFKTTVTINSAYRTTFYNRAIGGVDGSQHTKGTAADIAVRGVAPPLVAEYVEYLMPSKGGIGLYNDAKSGYFVHVDVRANRSRWHQVNGKETASAGFPGYVEEVEPVTPAPAEEEEEDMVRYKYLKDIPNENGFRDVIDTLMTAGIIAGDGSDPAGNGDVIDLSHDMVRQLIFEYQGGAFDRRLIAAGMQPRVNV